LFEDLLEMPKIARHAYRPHVPIRAHDANNACTKSETP
jgi:hypothetical protein